MTLDWQSVLTILAVLGAGVYLVASVCTAFSQRRGGCGRCGGCSGGNRSDGLVQLARKLDS
jgi:hypothetical protein